jgi:hypothetical protein
MNEDDDARRRAAVTTMDEDGRVSQLIKVGRLRELILPYDFMQTTSFASTRASPPS